MPIKYHADHRKIKRKLWGSEQVLVVDDERTTLDMLNEHLKSAGYKTLLAENGLQALDMLYEHKPCVVICDWLMPKLDGLELCRAVNALKEDYFVYFIMLTIRSKKEDIVEAFKVGTDDYLVKPFEREELLARVEAGVRIGGLCSELNEQVVKVHSLNEELNGLNAKLRKVAVTDNLTGLLNRRQAMLKMKEMWDMAKRYGHPFSCAMVDIDHFKYVNDVYGHLAGDNVLKQVAAILSESVRNVDRVYRIGGEEFLIIFPNSTVEEAKVIAQRCRELVESKRFFSEEEQSSVTISVGVSEYSPDMAKSEDLLQAADKLLYTAKDLGRNKVATPK